ncbi:MAG: CHAT domain-containing protein [Labilithrix sp.]|nr:CHAT domain-containing protein [Labilithrix sp.]
MTRRLFARALPLLFALGGAFAPAPAQADSPERKTVHVRPEDLEAAQAAVKKAAEGRKLFKENKLVESARMIDEALVELERTTGPDSDYSTSNRAVLVAIYRQLGEETKIKAVEARAGAARGKWSPPPARAADPNTAKAMPKLAAALEATKRGDFTTAAGLLEQAMPDVEKSDVSPKNYLLVTGVLASLYDHSQQFDKGEALRKTVIAKMEKQLGDSAEVAEQYEFFATHYMMRADRVKALSTQRRCVEITRKTSGISAILVDRLLTLAGLLTGAGELAASEAVLREATAMVKGLRPVDPLRMVRVARELTKVLDGQFRNADGDAAAEGACAIAAAANQPEVTEEAEGACIRTALAKKDTRLAGEIAARRFARTDKQFGSNPGLFASAAHELAQVRWAEGRKDEATALAKRAADAQERYLTRLLATGGDAQKRAHLGLVASQAYDLLSMGGNGEGGGSAQVRLALETILRRKGRALDASTEAARVVRLFDKPADKALAARQLELRRQIAALGLRGAGGLPGVDPATVLAKLEAEHDEIGNKLAAASPVYRAEARPVTIEAVQAAIPDDSALVEYVYYHARDTSSPVFATKEVRFVAFVLHKTGEPVVVDLGDAVPIGSAVSKLRWTLADRGDVLPHAKRVHDLLVAPLAKHLRPSDKRLIVSPDEDLNLVPFAALVDERGQFLLQAREITYVTSGRDLLYVAASSAQGRANTRPVVFGDPTFNVEGAGDAGAGARAGDLDGARFPPLPGTAVEAKAITELLAAASATQREATKSRLASVVSPVVLHVATHGFFLKREREPAAANTRALEYDAGEPAAVPPPRTANPLVRSGLALAGANQRTSADGLLTALEASSMNLEGTRLVVLSACETGVGETEVGDGVYGLRRALVVAGSESQLMSLWKVDDDATMSLMIAFYGDLKAGVGRAAALRKVQLAMLAKKETQHPYFWAAFIPSGAWSPMSFEQKAPAAASPLAKDRPATPERQGPPYPSLGGLAFLGAHYMTTTNLRDQPDRAGGLVGVHLEHALVSSFLGTSRGFGLHDAIRAALYVGLRTSDAATYASGAEEGSLSGGARGGYEMALGYRGSSFQAFVGGDATYSTFVLGDARTYGVTAPAIALLGFRAGDDTFVGLRGHYGKWIVDQESAGAEVSLDLDGFVLRAGLEELKMPVTVSLDGDEARASAQRQVSTLASFALGGTF